VSQSRSAAGLLALWPGLLASGLGLLASGLGLMLGLGLGSTLDSVVGVEVGRSVASWPSSVGPIAVQAPNSAVASSTAKKLRLVAFTAESPWQLDECPVSD
jgi:hypothetical protein